MSGAENLCQKTIGKIFFQKESLPPTELLPNSIKNKLLDSKEVGVIELLTLDMTYSYKDSSYGAYRYFGHVLSQKPVELEKFKNEVIVQSSEKVSRSLSPKFDTLKLSHWKEDSLKSKDLNKLGVTQSEIKELTTISREDYYQRLSRDPSRKEKIPLFYQNDKKLFAQEFFVLSSLEKGKSLPLSKRVLASGQYQMTSRLQDKLNVETLFPELNLKRREDDVWVEIGRLSISEHIKKLSKSKQNEFKKDGTIDRVSKMLYMQLFMGIELPGRINVNVIFNCNGAFFHRLKKIFGPNTFEVLYAEKSSRQSTRFHAREELVLKIKDGKLKQIQSWLVADHYLHLMKKSIEKTEDHLGLDDPSLFLNMPLMRSLSFAKSIKEFNREEGFPFQRFHFFSPDLPSQRTGGNFPRGNPSGHTQFSEIQAVRSKYPILVRSDVFGNELGFEGRWAIGKDGVGKYIYQRVSREDVQNALFMEHGPENTKSTVWGYLVMRGQLEAAYRVLKRSHDQIKSLLHSEYSSNEN